jgi:hypothetical protein
MYVTILCIVLTLLNLLLTTGVIRRLRAHSEQLAELAQATPLPEPMIPTGARPDPFTAETVDGEQVNETALVETLIGFFSPACASCEQWVPRFATAAAALPLGRRQALAVIVADDAAEAEAMAFTLRRVAQVVVEPTKGPVTTAFDVAGFPVIGRLDGNGAVVTNRAAIAIPLPAEA